MNLFEEFKYLVEQPEKKDEEEIPETPPEEVPAEEPAAPADPTTGADPSMDPTMGTDPSMGADPTMGGDPTLGGGDPTLGGMPGEEQKDEKDLGRVFELKKIFSRLLAIDNHLSSSPDPKLFKLKGYVNDALELFKLVVNNPESYKEKIDEIIVVYYKFIKRLYLLLEEYYKEKKEEVD